MKKHILLYLFLGAFTFTQAQNIELKNSSGASMIGDTLVFWHALDTSQFELDYYHKDIVTVVNGSTDTMMVDLIRSEINIIPNTGDYYCWGTQCFGEVNAGSKPVWVANDPVKTAPGDTAGGIGFSVYFAHKNSEVGEAKYQYEFYDQNNANYRASFYIRYSISYLTSIDEKALNKSFSVFPNPAQDAVQIKFDANLASSNMQVRMYNLIGEEVFKQNLSSGQGNVMLNTADLPAGVYFVNLISDGKMMATKKLTVQ